jgi:hypothetical protein
MSQPNADQAPGEKSSTKRIFAIAAMLVVLMVAAIVCIRGFWRPGFFVTPELDVEKVEVGVEEVLTDDVNGYGAKNVKDVTCNKEVNPVVEKGGMFDCTATVDGDKRQVTVTIQDESGTYEVGRPK